MRQLANKTTSGEVEPHKGASTEHQTHAREQFEKFREHFGTFREHFGSQVGRFYEEVARGGGVGGARGAQRIPKGAGWKGEMEICWRKRVRGELTREAILNWKVVSP
jgi:hypothetical protein